MSLPSVQTDRENLLLDEKSQARFELGVCMALDLWEDLNVAVDNQWGGGDSADKRDWMAGAVVELFETSNYVDAEDIEYRILNIMEDEFGVTIEDDTGGDVADHIISLYRQCSQQNYTEVDKLFEVYQTKKREKIIINVDEPDEEIEENSSDEEMMDVESTQTTQTSNRQEPIIDEDGFELVQKKR